MVSLKNFVEDLREERREEKERGLMAFTLILSVFFLAPQYLGLSNITSLGNINRKFKDKSYNNEQYN